ncbi:MAG: hypothetical protein M0D55_12340 [Elusimicrobiota bacterium]|nr:MAG: hypothetical protein M0D55_12340 [Elusimicrobiota bacterium]
MVDPHVVRRPDELDLAERADAGAAVQRVDAAALGGLDGRGVVGVEDVGRVPELAGAPGDALAAGAQGGALVLEADPGAVGADAVAVGRAGGDRVLHVEPGLGRRVAEQAEVRRAEERARGDLVVERDVGLEGALIGVERQARAKRVEVVGAAVEGGMRVLPEILEVAAGLHARRRRRRESEK